MGRADYHESGDWNAACYECGRKRKASDLIKHWQGYYVCPEHWEPRHPQDFVRAVPDIQAPPWTQDQNDVFIGFCTADGISSFCDLAVADCAVCDLITIWTPAPYVPPPPYTGAISGLATVGLAVIGKP